MSNESEILPINDLAVEVQGTDDNISRRKLAALYRLVDLKGWSWSIYNHITIRSKVDPDHFLVNPYGLLYSEITAASLLKVDKRCNVVEQGSTTYGLNRAGFIVHSAIHHARPDVNAVIHIHTGTGAGMSTLKCGFLPISQESMICLAGSGVSYHEYDGIPVDMAMCAGLAKSLGPKNKILIMRNHGAAFCGATIEEAYFWLITFMTAVEIQSHGLSAAGGCVDNVTLIGDDILEKTKRLIYAEMSEKSLDGIDWQVGDLETEAEMRRLDKLGYKTGYPYKKPASAN